MLINNPFSSTVRESNPVRNHSHPPVQGFLHFQSRFISIHFLQSTGQTHRTTVRSSLSPATIYYLPRGSPPTVHFRTPPTPLSESASRMDSAKDPIFQRTITDAFSSWVELTDISTPINMAAAAMLAGNWEFTQICLFRNDCNLGLVPRLSCFLMDGIHKLQLQVAGFAIERLEWVNLARRKMG